MPIDSEIHDRPIVSFRDVQPSGMLVPGLPARSEARFKRLQKPFSEAGITYEAAAKPKFAVRAYTRCQRCGRPHSVYRKFGLCRVCVREMAHAGELPGVTKSSW